MLETKTKVLVHSIKKLYRRAAWKNISRILNKTHAADIAALIEELDRNQRFKIFSLISSLDIKAEVLSYLEVKNQKELVLSLDKTEVQVLVSHMDSDDAADLLGSLPKEQSQEILDKMEKRSSEDVADLMRYPEDTAGGLMSTDFLALNQNLSVSEAIKEIQENADENIVSFYIYVVNDEGHLVGVLSLKQLILSKPSKTLKSIMSTEVISVGLQTDQEDVARVVERYDFLSIPVVDESQKLEGIITVDDVIDVIRAEGADDFLAMGRASDVDEENFIKNTLVRLPWLIFSFAGGALCFVLVTWLGVAYDTGALLILAAMIPMLLSMGATAGGQSATIAVGLINSGKFEGNYTKYVFHELFRGLIFSFFFSILLLFKLKFFYDLGQIDKVYLLSLVLGLQVFLCVFIGTCIPLVLHKIGKDPTIGSVAFFSVIADILSIILLFSIAFR